ncbi:MAG: family 10 glycosylhydrolase [Verrucomicrobia bacterium]|nr:family 10 glycosylhydrolase [Verrucomicrobiota bacterium]
MTKKEKTFIKALAILLAGGVVCSFASHAANADEPSPLPVVGTEYIDGTNPVYDGQYGPPGDPEPTQGTGNQLHPSRLSVALDYQACSVVADLGDNQLVQRIELCDTGVDNKGNAANLNAENLEIYRSHDNRTFEKVPRGTFRQYAGTNGVFDVVELSGLRFPARYIKVHSTYAGTQYDFASDLNRMVRVFGYNPGPRVRLPFGLLKWGANQIQVSTRHFEELPRMDCEMQLVSLRDGKRVMKSKKTVRWPEPGKRPLWSDVPVQIPECEPGLYRLTVQRMGPLGGPALWTTHREIRVVKAIKDILPLVGNADADRAEPQDAVGAAPGNCLLSRPGPSQPALDEWLVDRANSQWPLWRRTGPDAKLIFSLKDGGSYAIYAGLCGSPDGLSVTAGTKTLVPISTSGKQAGFVHETYLGILDPAQVSELTLRLKQASLDAGIAWIKILCLTPRQQRLVRGEEDLSLGRKLIYVTDGFSQFGALTERPQFGVPELLNTCVRVVEGSHGLVERFDYCPGSSSVIFAYPAKVGELVGKRGKYATNYDRFVEANVLALIEKGIAPLKVVADGNKKQEVQTYAAWRVNSYYDAPFADFLNSEFWRENRQLSIVDYTGKQQSLLSYAYPEVRNYHGALLREMLDYNVGGIHLEFMRQPPFMGFDEPLLKSYAEKYSQSPLDPQFKDWEKWHRHRAEVMTGFVRQVRAMLDEEGKKRGQCFGLSARIPAQNYFRMGLDPKQWIKEGLIDMLAPGSNDLPNHPMPLEPFLEMAKGTACRIYSSFSPEQGDGRDNLPEDDAKGDYSATRDSGTDEDYRRNFVIREFRKGALGVYMFNNQGADWTWYRNLERWDEFQNPRRLGRVEP